MLERIKEHWSDLKSGRAGSRFQEQYDENRRKAQSGPGRILRVVGGMLLFPIGVFLLAVPGPGLLAIALGAVLIAREFGFAAKALDRLEVRGRRLGKSAQQRWRRLVQARRKVVNR